MTAFPSKEALEKLCQHQPDKPLKYGFGKLTGGLALDVIGVGIGWFGYNNRETFFHSLEHVQSDTLYNSIGIGVGVITAACAVGSAVYGLYLTADGITSISKPFLNSKKEGEVYYRNGGLINTPTLFDKHFGTKVHPLDDFVSGAPEKDYVFSNGIIIRKTGLHIEEKSRMVTKTVYYLGKPTIAQVPESYTQYTAFAEGLLNDKSITISTITEDASYAQALANLKPNNQIYAMGYLINKSQIDVTQFDKAFLK